ncbi:MAG: InlB B-repeat-containing protein [Roseburia sp.]|nr:InlB B-repeat-containing protein [Roseburia sp.]
MKKLIIIAALAASAVACALFFTACDNSQSYGLSISGDIENGRIVLTQTSAKEGEKVRLASMPSAGYRLSGYKVDGESIEGNTFIMPNKQVEISAEFEVVQYSVTYVLNGGTVEGNNPASYTVESGDLPLIAPKIEGFEFGYWYTYTPEYGEFYYELEDYKVEKIAAGTTGKLTLYAKFYNVPHTIEIDNIESDKIDVGASSYEAEKGEEITLYCYSLNEHCEFLYFTVNGEKIEGDTFEMPNENVIVSAVIKPIEYKIEYVLDDGINPPENPASYTYFDDSIELADAEKEGYEFLGWYYIDDDGDESYISTIYGADAKDYVLYAYFAPIVDNE